MDKTLIIVDEPLIVVDKLLIVVDEPLVIKIMDEPPEFLDKKFADTSFVHIVSLHSMQYDIL